MQRYNLSFLIKFSLSQNLPLIFITSINTQYNLPKISKILKFSFEYHE